MLILRGKVIPNPKDGQGVRYISAMWVDHSTARLKWFHKKRWKIWATVFWWLLDLFSTMKFQPWYSSTELPIKSLTFSELNYSSQKTIYSLLQSRFFYCAATLKNAFIEFCGETPPPLFSQVSLKQNEVIFWCMCPHNVPTRMILDFRDYLCYLKLNLGKGNLFASGLGVAPLLLGAD